MHLNLLGIVTLCLAAAAWGCSAKATKAPVEGTVTLDGQPVAKGTIQFTPINGQGQTAGAVILDGRYSLESSPGAMRVVISAPKVVSQRKAYDSPDSPMIEQVQEQLPERYSGPKSELQTTVELEKQNTADFALKSEGEMPAPSKF